MTSKNAAPIDKNNKELFTSLLKRHKISSDEYTRIEAAIGRTPSLAEL